MTLEQPSLDYKNNCSNIAWMGILKSPQIPSWIPVKIRILVGTNRNRMDDGTRTDEIPDRHTDLREDTGTIDDWMVEERGG